MNERDNFLHGMGTLPGGATIVTIGMGGERGGLVATAVCSLSADPPSLLVCVNKSASAHQPLISSGRFAVNILTPEHREMALAFSKSGTSAAERFPGDIWDTLDCGTPALRTAAAVFICVLDRVVDGFSHSILIGLVQRTHLHADGGDGGLVWQGRRFRSVADFPTTGM